MTTIIQPKENLAELVRQESGQNVLLCYQCKKCTAGCPFSDLMDLTPNQIMRALQLGLGERALGSRTAWLCSSCETCTTRCPMNIDVAKVMDTLKILSQKRGLKPQVPKVSIFTQAVMRNINLLGRMFELGLMAEMNLRSGQLTDHLDLGLRMLKLGKLRLWPEVARYPKGGGRLGRERAETKALAYYPGCSLHGTAEEYDTSTRAVAEALGLHLEEPKGWICCGTSAAHWTSHQMAALLPLKNLALVERMGHQKVTAPCAACYSRLKRAIYDWQRDPHLQKVAERETGHRFEGQVEVQHSLDTFLKEVEAEKITSLVKKPLHSLKVVCYYGCLITRPAEVMGDDHPEYPVQMDRLLKMLGADVLDWSAKTDCCGGAHVLTQTELALRATDRILTNAEAVGAEAVVVACPLCHATLDGHQEEMAQVIGAKHHIPVFYFTQLMGLAFDLPQEDLGLNKLLTDPKPLLESKGLLPG